MIGALALAVMLAAAPVTCTVDGATIDWGFKESFRSYISGTIANGQWTVADGATYATPDFGFSGGTGTLEAGTGTIAFPGSIEFTGHGGILDTIVANPQLRFDGSDSGMLLLDVSGMTQEGLPIDEKAVEFAVVDLRSATTTNGTYDLAAAPVTLTSAGAKAFGTYDAGTALDPIAVSFSASQACLAHPDAAPVLLVIGVVFALVVLGAVLTAVLVVVLLARRARRDSLAK